MWMFLETWKSSSLDLGLKVETFFKGVGFNDLFLNHFDIFRQKRDE